MFLQIELVEKDRDVHRYLWRHMKINEEPKVYRMQRVTFGVNCSPFLTISTGGRIYLNAIGRDWCPGYVPCLRSEVKKLLIELQATQG
eukprot:gene2513-708_t